MDYVAFRLYFSGTVTGERGMDRKNGTTTSGGMLMGADGCVHGRRSAVGRGKQRLERKPCACSKEEERASKKAPRELERGRTLCSGRRPASKGEWGSWWWIERAGRRYNEQNADKFFVPASNMKLFSTALALAKTRARISVSHTLEPGSDSSEGVLGGEVALVGAGATNLSNRDFPIS